MLNIEASYFIFAFVAVVGVLQVMAARHKLRGLSFIRDMRKPLPGYLLGAVLIVGTFGWFFSTQKGIFIPGPAGAQFLFLFSTASLCALVATLLLSTLIHHSPPLRGRGRSLRCQRVSFEGGQGELYTPPHRSPPWPAVCIVPSPVGGGWERIAADLAESGFVVLVAELSVSRYPEILTLLPEAVSYLSARDGVDHERIGAIGLDLGGDLTICAVTSDKRIKAAIALAPLIEEESARPGLRLLREMSYLQAVRWFRFLDGGGLLARLKSKQHAEKIGPQPFLAVYGEEDGLVSLARARQALGAAGELKFVGGEGHTSLFTSPTVASMVVQWFKEKL